MIEAHDEVFDFRIESKALVELVHIHPSRPLGNVRAGLVSHWCRLGSKAVSRVVMVPSVPAVGDVGSEALILWGDSAGGGTSLGISSRTRAPDRCRKVMTIAEAYEDNDSLTELAQTNAATRGVYLYRALNREPKHRL